MIKTIIDESKSNINIKKIQNLENMKIGNGFIEEL